MTLEQVAPYRSYSSLTTFTSCGKQWELSRKWKVPETPAWYLAGGSAVHEATEENDRNGSPVLTELEAVDLFAQHFERNVTEQIEKTGIPVTAWRAGGRRSKAYPDKEDARWWVDHGPGMVKLYSEWWKSLQDSGWQIWTGPGDLLGIELTLVANFGDVPVKMGIDRLVVSPLGELAVIDLKSGSREPDSNLQLGVYASGLENTIGTRPTYGAYYMARTGTLTDLANLDGYTTAILAAELATFNRAIDAEIFLPRRGSHCISCGVRRACAAVGGDEAPRYDPLHPDYHFKEDA